MLKLKSNSYFKKLQIALLAIMVIVSSCGESSKKEDKKEDGFQLTGTINGFSGEIKACTNYGENVLGTIEVKDGLFSFSHNFPVPTQFTLETEDRSVYIGFWAENSKMSLTATKVTTQYGDRYEAEFTGGEFQAGEEHFRKAYDEFRKKQPYNIWELREKEYDPKATDKEKKEAEEKVKEYELAVLGFQKQYIRENNTNPYIAHIIWERLTTKVGGESAKELKEWAAPIDPSIKNHPYVKMMFDMLNTMLETEGGLEKFVAGVHDVKYKVDKTYKGSAHKNVVYLAIMNNDNLCALTTEFGIHDQYNAHGQNADTTKTFFIQIIDPLGDEVSRFEVKEEGLASTIAADGLNNIYVLITVQKEVEFKYRGRITKQVKNDGVKCYVYNAKGEKLKAFKLEGLEQATGARIYKDKLLVSDVGTAQLGIYNKEDGKLLSTIEDLRPCCSILDFDIDNNTGHILAANLGSFRVDGYDLTGKKLVSFGQRGRSLDDFHSCCNPVSVRKLNSGAVITVEKAPTRIKVYSQEGAKMVEGIEELVEGCFHIPMMSDSKDNIYLASPEKGLVKCVVI